MNPDNIGTITFTKFDGTKLRLHGRYVAAADGYGVRESLTALIGKEVDDPAAMPLIRGVIEKTIGGWEDEAAYSFESLAKSMSCRELAALAVLAPEACRDLEVAIEAARGGRKFITAPDGSPAFDYTDNTAGAPAKAE